MVAVANPPKRASRAFQRTGASPYYFTHIYDPVGNRTEVNRDSERTTFSYDFANQLETSTYLPGPDVTTYVYDAAGNLENILTDTNTFSYSWDGAGHMISTTPTEGGNTYTLTYDALGRRVGYRNSAAPYERRYTFDGDNLLLVRSRVSFPFGPASARCAQGAKAG